MEMEAQHQRKKHLKYDRARAYNAVMDDWLHSSPLDRHLRECTDWRGWWHNQQSCTLWSFFIQKIDATMWPSIHPDVMSWLHKRFPATAFPSQLFKITFKWKSLQPAFMCIILVVLLSVQRFLAFIGSLQSWCKTDHEHAQRSTWNWWNAGIIWCNKSCLGELSRHIVGSVWKQRESCN